MPVPDFTLGQGSEFIPAVLPAQLSRDAIVVDDWTGGVDIGQDAAGREIRLARWNAPLVEVDIGPGVRTLKTLHDLRTFHRRMLGPTNTFLFSHFLWHTTARPTGLKDRRAGPAAFTDMQFGTGDGVETVFQIAVAFGDQSEAVHKFLDTPQIGIAGVLQDTGSSPAPYALDTALATSTGEITFAAPPAPGAALTWGGRYYIGMRFRDMRLPINHQNYDRGIAQVILRQTRDFG